MTLLALISRWLLSGGWKIAGLAVLSIAAGLFILRVQHWHSEALRAQTLAAQIANTDKRTEAVLSKLAKAEQKRGAAEAALSAWQTTKSVTLDPIKDEGRHAPASTNPVCAPSADDRRLRNDAIKQLLGQTGGSSGMPASATTPH